MNGSASLFAAMELIAAAFVILFLGILLTWMLGMISGSALDLSMIAGAIVVVGGALALGVSALADRHE